MHIYTLRMPKSTSTFTDSHVFEAKPGSGRGCICLPKSLCQMVATAETVGVEGYMCLSGERMWEKTFAYQGEMCPDCLAKLSVTAEKPE